MSNLKNLYRHVRAHFTGERFLSISNKPDHFHSASNEYDNPWKKGEVFHARTEDGLGFMAVVTKDFNPFSDRYVSVAFITTRKDFVEGMASEQIDPTTFCQKWRRDSNGETFTAAPSVRKPCNLKEL